MNLALFDFDGTLTHEDTFSKFVFYATPKWRLALGFILLAPILLFYKSGMLRASVARPIVAFTAYSGRKASVLREIANRYADEYIPSVERADAMEHFAQHRHRGDRIVIVSASLNLYLQAWCAKHSVEYLCNELSVKGNRITGKFSRIDCGANKAKLIRNSINLKDYETVYAYGDTVEDEPMLALADVRYFRGVKQ